MSADSRLLLLVFAVLVTIVSAPFVVDVIRESRRPVLAEARVVTATASDPVFRTGQRKAAAAEDVEIALAVRATRAGREDLWISPVPELVVDGTPVPHLQSDQWPDDDHTIRVFWFTVECSYIGGVLTEDNAAERLQYRTYLAPEMGRGLAAQRMPDYHSDDHLGGSVAAAPAGAGTVRLYARAEVVETAGDLRPLQAATSLGIEHLAEPRFPAVMRGADLGAGVRTTAGELFGLPGFEPAGESAAQRNEVTVPAFDRGFAELVEQRLVVSSWTLAAVAVSGRASVEPSTLIDLGEVSVSDEGFTSGGRPVAWGSRIVSGDLLVDGTHWLVLLADNGDGVLDVADTVLHSWHGPPQRTTLYGALDPRTQRIGHRRAAP